MAGESTAQRSHTGDLTYTGCRFGAGFKKYTFSSQKYFQALLSMRDKNWLVPAISEAAKSDTAAWTSELLAGYVSSADTGNEELVIASRAALCDFCRESEENLDQVCVALVHNLKTRQGQDRVVVPSLEIVAF